MHLPKTFAVGASYHHNRIKETKPEKHSVTQPDHSRIQVLVHSAVSLCLSNALSWSSVVWLVLSTEQKDYKGGKEMDLAWEV